LTGYSFCQQLSVLTGPQVCRECSSMWRARWGEVWRSASRLSLTVAAPLYCPRLAILTVPKGVPRMLLCVYCTRKGVAQYP
jgi:hypothetical protein